MIEDLDTIRQELVRIADQLELLDSEHRVERLGLRERQRDLRATAQRLVDGRVGVEELRRREAELLTILERLGKRRLSGSSIGGGGGQGGGGIDPYEASRLNEAISEGSGATQIREELSRIRARLDRAARATEDG